MTIECYIKECPYHSIHDSKPGENEGPYCFESTCKAARLSSIKGAYNDIYRPRPRVLIENNEACIHYAANPYQQKYHTLCGILQTVSAITTGYDVTCATCINIDVQLHGQPMEQKVKIPVPITQQYIVRYTWAPVKGDYIPRSAICYFDATSIADTLKQFWDTWNDTNPLLSISIKPSRPTTQPIDSPSSDFPKDVF